MIEQLILTMVKPLVSQPEVVSATQVFADNKSVIHLKVAAQDLSRIIGGEGRIMRSIKTIVHHLCPGKTSDIMVDIIS